MQHLKAFIGVALVVTIIGTLLSATLSVPFSISFLFLNGLMIGAMISGLSVFLRISLLDNKLSDQLAYTMTTAASALAFYLTVSGDNYGSVMAVIASVAFGAVSGFIGSFATRIGGR